MRYLFFVLCGVLLLSLPAQAVVPQLFGPFQALLSIMPQLLLFVIAGVAALFKFHTWKRLAQRLYERMRSHLLVTGLIVLVLVAGGLLFILRPKATAVPSASPAASGEWVAFRGGVARTGHLDDQPGPSHAEEIWRFQADGRTANFSSSPAVAGNRLLIGGAQASVFSSHGQVYCLDAFSGDEIWHVDTPRPVFSSPAIVGNRVAIGEGLHTDTDSQLYCLDIRDGSQLWAFQTNSHVESSPFVLDGRVYFGAGEDGVYCLDAITGDEIWRYPGVHVDASPAVWDGRVYFGTGYGESAIYALDAATGERLWRTPTPYSVWGSPAVADGAVYFGLGNGNYVEAAPEAVGQVLSLDAGTGVERWHYDTDATVLTAMALRDGIAYVGARNGHVYALRASDGELIWEVPLSETLLAAPAVDNQTCYVALSSGWVQALDRLTGKPLWHQEVPTRRLLSSPAIAHGNLYFGIDEGGVVALGN